MKAQQILSQLFKRGYRCRPVMETFDMRWTNRFSFRCESVLEAISLTLKANERGGVVIFSTDVNATAVSTNALVRWLETWWKSLENRVRAQRKLDTALQGVSVQAGEQKVGGYSVGNFFKGRYVDANTGTVYNEKSLAVEVLFISHRPLIELATQIARDFKQQAVLVKDHENHEFYLMDQFTVAGDANRLNPELQAL